MGSATTVPLHFSLEFLSVSAFGGLLVWAIQSRRPRSWVPLAVLLVGQTLHAGQFVTGQGASRAVAWITVAAAAATAVSRVVEEVRLWSAGWIALIAGGLALALTDPHALSPTNGEILLHLPGSAGAVALGVWVARRAARSVRLRVVGAFVLVLLVIVVIAGGSVVRVVSVNVERDQFQRLGDQLQAEVRALSRSQSEIELRASFLSQAFTRQLTGGGSPAELAAGLRRELFKDLSFIAFYTPDRALSGHDGMTAAEAAPVGASSAVTASIETLRSGRTLIPVEGTVVFAAGAPVFRANVPQVRENMLGVVVVGVRYDGSRLEEGPSGVEAAIALPDGIAARTADLDRSVTLPGEGLAAVAATEPWQGSVRDHFAAAVPIAPPGSPSPVSLVLLAPNDVLARTTTDVSRALFAAMLAATMVAVTIALWFGARLTRPILDLTGTARQVEAGDLDARAAIHAPDELGVLAAAFEGMTGSLKETLATEQETRERLEAVVGGMADGLIAMDADLNITAFNRAAEEITGFKAADAIGRRCYEVYGELTSGRDGQPICDYLCPVRHAGGRDTGVAIDLPDGRTRALAVTCSPLRDAEGNVYGGVDLLSDVTPEIQAERMKSNFLANISHELRTPLTPIRGYADILRRREVPLEQRIPMLDEITKATERLERIIRILVDVAAMEAGRLQVKLESVDAATLVREAAARWTGRSPGHRVRAVAERGLPAVEADETYIGRVLDELIDNAIKFSPGGGAVELRASSAQRGVAFSVRDRGIGITPDELDQLFQDFRQVDGSETRRFGGLGVGLGFVRRVIDAHGGKLEVDSVPGRGTIFSFVLRRTRRRAPVRERSGRTG